MKHTPVYYAFILFLFVFVALFGTNTTVFAQGAQAEWTLMFYMDSDNNLEDPQMVDLEEMMAVGGNANVNIIVLADRNILGEDEPGYTNRAVGGLKNWTTAKLLSVEKGKLRQLADWGEINMGDPAMLKRFIKTVSTQFPAKRFGLVFGDHGSGWMGIVGDESNGGDTLDMTELQTGLKEVFGQTEKLALIGFDACLMANFETAKALVPFAKTMVASEELEPGDGWSYTPIMAALTKNPQMDGVALGKIIVDSYREYYLGPKAGYRDKTVTLSVIDLTQIPALEIAVNNLGVRNQSYLSKGVRENWLKTAAARKKTAIFGGSDGTDLHFYDLHDYANNLKRETPDSETTKAADAVMAATKAAVIYKMNGDGHPRASGMSIYFPNDVTTADDKYLLTPFSLTGKWVPFLSEFMGIKIADKQSPVVENVATTSDKMTEDGVITVTAHVDADDVAEATFVLAESYEDGQIIIGAVPTSPNEEGILHEEWDGTWFTIGDGQKELICPITDFQELEEENTFIAEVPAQVRLRNSKRWRDVTLYFYIDFNAEESVGEFIYAFEFTGNQAREINLKSGDLIRPVYLLVDEKGDTTEIASEEAENILKVAKDDNIYVGGTDVSAGDYLLGFLVTDYADNTTEEFVAVTIE